MALANISPNTIMLDVGSDSKTLEGFVLTGISILPGSSVSYINSTNEFTKTAAGIDVVHPLMIAVENTAEGKSPTDTYAQLTKLYARYMRPGDLFLALVEDIVVSFNQPLSITAAVTGQFGAVTADNPNVAMVYAAEASASTGGSKLVKVFAK